MQRAGERTGIKIYKDSKGSDDYFNASDNFSLAEVGVPAETLCVAFDYPDYHAVGDEWQKIDYDNMAKVDRAIALAMFLMADSEQPVRLERGQSEDGAVRQGLEAARSGVELSIGSTQRIPCSGIATLTRQAGPGHPGFDTSTELGMRP